MLCRHLVRVLADAHVADVHRDIRVNRELADAGDADRCSDPFVNTPRPPLGRWEP